jgi:phosphate butyryltransferase
MTSSPSTNDSQYTDLSQIHQWAHENFLRGAEEVPDGRCRVALAPAQDQTSLKAVDRAYKDGYIQPLLVGHQSIISRVADEAEIWNLSDWEVFHESEPLGAVARAAELVKQGTADILMRGRILAYDFFKTLFHPDVGLRKKGEYWSQVGILQIPDFPRLLIISDCGLNVNPDIHQKVRIIGNAIDLAHRLGISRPKVALLAAVEAVYLKMPVLVEESILAHFSSRGGFTGAVVDGPLSLDLAISPQAVEKKKMKGEVAGKADILIVNNIYVGNSLYKSLVTLGGAQSASVVMGGSVPIVLPSRSETAENMEHSLALAAGLWAQQSVNSLAVGS